ncbi:MAG: hypothetical protein II649_11060, partial [Kiritimatiellae bacterium]|nr:hypothetical protein [Kiritimatiellia bacterium]
MRKLAMAIAAGIAAVAIQAAPQRDGHSPARPAGNARHVQQQGQKAPKTAQKPSRGGTSRTMRHIIRRDDGRDSMDKRDRRLIERIEEADSPRELRRYMQEAAASREKAVRMAMV